MKTNKKNIDKMVSKILSEEIDKKSSEMVEKLSRKQEKYLDVAKPKGKLTLADFKTLGTGRNSEMKEWGYDSMTQWDDEDLGRYNAMSDRVKDSEEEIDFEDMEPKKKESFLGKLKNKIFSKKETDEEVKEGNAFTDALRKTKKGGKFKLGGKEYTDRSELDEFFFDDNDDAEELSDNEPTYVGRGLKDNKMKADLKNRIYGSFSDVHGWYDDTDREFMGDFGDDYDEETFDDFKTFNKKYGGKQRWFSPGKQGEGFFNKYKETYGSPFRVRKSKLGESLKLTETEMVDLIESIVLKEKEKENIAKKYISGLAKTVKAQEQSKKENEDNIEMVTKKIKEYLKGASTDKDFDMNPKDFPKGNGQDKKDDIKAYQKSDAVDEYIEAFAFPGQTNLVYDEIKPEDEKVEMYLKGDRKTGNAEVDEDGNPLGNVVPSKVGERFMKNYEENLYGAEQMGSSYKRYPQPVDVAGEKKGTGTLKSKASKAQKVIDKVEESEIKKQNVINEEMVKMKNLINYSKKTQ